MKAFFFSQGKFSPIYFWATVCMLLIICMLVMRMFKIADLSDTLILGMFAGVNFLIGVYSWDKRNKLHYNGGDHVDTT